MLNGLSEKFDNIVNVIQHQTPFPTFTKARSMLLMEEKRLSKQVKVVPQHNTTASSPDVLYASQDQRSSNYNGNNNTSRGNGGYNKNRGRGGRNNRGRGRSNNNNQWSYNHQAPPWSYNPNPWMYQAPYGAPSGYPPQIYAPPPSISGYSLQPNTHHGSYPQRQHGEAHFTQSAPPTPSAGSTTSFFQMALPQAFSTMSM